MPPAPRISVLMPSFEQAHFLPRALASLQAQSLDAWEAVIVDDGSRDATWRANVWRQRESFAFDTHVPALLGFFREVMEHAPAYRPHSRSARG